MILNVTVCFFALHIAKLPVVVFSFIQDGFSVSPDEALELEAVDEWLEMMADFESAESDHLIALAMR
jgi:hypothetical protein